MTPSTAGARRFAAALTAFALLVVGCTPDEPADPEEALVDTVRTTFEGAFAYRLVAEADREALEELGQGLGSVAARLNLLEVAGVVDGEVTTANVALFSTTPLLQFRRFRGDRLYLRANVSQGVLASVFTPELEGRLLGLALQTGQPDSMTAALEALFDGDWIGIEGAFPTDVLLGGTEPPPGAATGAPDTPLPSVVADHIVVREQVDDDGRTRFRVELRVRELMRTLASLGAGPEAAGVDPDDFEEGLGLLPEAVTGDVVVRDDRVREVVFDVAAAAREDGVDIPGSLQLRLELTDHGEPAIPEEPQAAVVVPSADLAGGLSSLLSTDALTTGDGPTGTPTPSPEPSATSQ